MRISCALVLLVVAWSVSGCANPGYFGEIYGPVHAGVSKGEQPYSGGEWLGPIPVEIYEGALLEYHHSPERKQKQAKPTLIEKFYPKSWFPAEKQWRSLKQVIQPGDELWEFRGAQFAVDVDPIYFGVCIVRNGRVVDAITTKVVND